MKSNKLSDLSDKEVSICQVIKSVNLLYQYPLSVDQIADWGVSINNLKPNLYLEDLQLAMNKLIVGDCEFNPNLGIQNIFTALKSLERPMVY